MFDFQVQFFARSFAREAVQLVERAEDKADFLSFLPKNDQCIEAMNLYMACETINFFLWSPTILAFLYTE